MSNFNTAQAIDSNETDDYHYQFYKLVTQISTRLINVEASDIDQEIQEALNLIGDFAKADRAYIMLLSGDQQSFSMEFEWHNDNCESAKSFYRGQPIKLISGVFDSNDISKTIHYPDISDLPLEAEELKKLLLLREIKSIILVPLICQENVIGIVGFSALKHSRCWGKETVALLEISARIFSSILEKKYTENALLESHYNFHTLIESLGEGVLYCNSDDKVLHINGRFSEMTAYSLEETLGKRAFELFVDPEHVDNFKNHTALRLQGISESYEILLKRKDGSNFWALIHSTPIRNSNNEVTGTLAAVTDITERRKAEEALREQKEFLRAVIDLMPNYIYTRDLEGRFTMVNQAVSDVYNTPIKEIIGKKIFDFYPNKKQAEQFVKQDREIFENDQDRLVTEEQVELPGGERHWYQTIKKPLKFANGKVSQVLGVSTDFTERKRIEEENLKLQRQLTQAQKMEAIGQLAAGVAHDLNNSLSAVVGHLQLIEMNQMLSPQVKSSLDVALKGCERASSLIDHLLGFSRQGKYDLKTIDLKDALSDALVFLKRVIRSDISVKVTKDLASLKIEADPNQLQQALTNLIINAQQSMPDGGTVSFKFDIEEVLFPERFNTKAKAGKFAVIKIHDTGEGIKPEHIDKIFEPFFTTKQDQGGSGLGLAMVYGIMQNHQGWVSVSSEPNKGTSFSLFFPLIEGVESKDSHDLIQISKATKRTVVVIDDEPFLVDLASKFLNLSGYKAVGFTEASDAVTWFKENAPEVDLVILDMKMAKMDGQECFEALKAIDPKVRVIILSGYIQDEAAQAVMKAGAIHFFQKPLRYQELMEEVSKILA